MDYTESIDRLLRMIRDSNDFTETEKMVLEALITSRKKEANWREK